MIAGWNRFFHNIPSVHDSQGPREEAKSYRPAIPSSLACRPLVQGHNYFIFSYTALTPTNGAHLISSYNDSCKHCPWIQLFVAFTSAMVLLANISRMLKQLPLTARTWGHFQVAKNKPQRQQKRPRENPPHLHGELHFSHLGLRLWGLHHHALWQRHFGTRAGMTQRYGLQGVWKCETHLTLKCGNKEVRCKILTHSETIEKTLQVVDCEKHFALWTGMVWTRSSQDWS